MTSQFWIRAAVAAPLALASPLCAQSTSPAPAAAVAAPTGPCTGPEHRQLDFWVGTWIAEWETNGVKGTGRNVVTKDEYGACVIIEHFTIDDHSLKGTSISTYSAPAREWRQTWMDDQGGYFDLFGGPSLEPSAKFGLQEYRRYPNSPWLRMIWQDVTPNSFTWRWQAKNSEQAPWEDRWVIHYRRAS